MGTEGRSLKNSYGWENWIVSTSYNKGYRYAEYKFTFIGSSTGGRNQNVLIGRWEVNTRRSKVTSGLTVEAVTCVKKRENIGLTIPGNCWSFEIRWIS